MDASIDLVLSQIRKFYLVVDFGEVELTIQQFRTVLKEAKKDGFESISEITTEYTKKKLGL